MTKKPTGPSFEQCLKMMRKHDPQVQEEGFHYLLDQAPEYANQLLAQFKVEEDVGIRRWLLELIGEARSPAALRLLAECLRSDDASSRWWAIRGLKKLDTKDARRILWEARLYTLATDGETQEFLQTLETSADPTRKS